MLVLLQQCVLVFGAFTLLLLIDKVGRPKLLLVHGTSMTLSTSAMGIFYVFNSSLTVIQIKKTMDVWKF